MLGIDKANKILLAEDPKDKDEILFWLQQAKYAVLDTAEKDTIFRVLNAGDVAGAVVNLNFLEDPADFQQVSLARKSRIPVLLLTEKEDFTKAILALRNGAMEILKKPIERELLLTSLKRAIDKLRSETPPISHQPPEIETIKFQSLLDLVSSNAHDVNNLLTVITTCAGMLRQLNLGEECQKYVSEILEACEHACSMNRQLLSFCRTQTIKPEVLDLNGLIQNLRDIFARLLGREIDLKTVLSDSPCTILADRNQLEQVLLNLTVNARDAISGKGEVAISTEKVQIDLSSNVGDFSVLPGDYVKLSYSDTGCGMEEKIKNRIFDPFFTTKKISKGSGVGLATVHRIIRKSGGYVSVDSEVGKGTTFVIFFPLLEKEKSGEYERSIW